MKKKLSILLALLMTVSMLAGCTGEVDTPTAGATDPAPAPALTPSSGPAGADAPATQSGSETSSENADRIVHLAVNAAWPSLDPMFTNAIIMLEVNNNVYEPLIRYNYEEGEGEVACLAESWEVSADGTVWIFKLRQGVKFHNGEPFTAADVVYSFDRAMTMAVMNAHMVGIVDYEAQDDYTFVVTLDAPRPAFSQNLALIPMMNEKFVTEVGDGISTSACGTGPYEMISADLAVSCEIARFEDYWGELGPIKGATWDVITDTTTQLMALEGGDLDFIRIPHVNYAEFADKDGFEMGMLPTFHGVFVCFNSNRAPFDNPLVRQAMCYLINNEDVSIACFEGLAETDGIILNRNLAGLPSWDVMKQYDYEYNPEKGLELLRQAGYDTTKEIDLGEIISYAEGHYITKACPVIQANLAAYGIKLEINAMETNTFADLLYAGEYTMAMAGGAWGGDASMYEKIFGSYGIESGDSFIHWGDAEADAAWAAAATEVDPAARADYFEEVIRITMEAAPCKAIGHKYETYSWTNELNPYVRINKFLINEWAWK